MKWHFLRILDSLSYSHFREENKNAMYQNNYLDFGKEGKLVFARGRI